MRGEGHSLRVSSGFSYSTIAAAASSLAEHSRPPIAWIVIVSPSPLAVYRTTLPIAASAETVWKILTDFERYPEWNPSLPSINGELRAGNTVALTLGMPGRPSPKVKAKFGDVAPGRRLTWHGNAGADWLFAGDREFVIDAQRDGTVRFTHVEDVHGVLFPLFRAVMGSAIQRSHDAFNAALKKRAEGEVSTASA